MSDFKYELQVYEVEFKEWFSHVRGKSTFALQVVAKRVFDLELKDEGTLFRIVEVD